MKTIQIELNDFLAAIIGIAAGLLLLVFPQEAINVITYGIGIVSLVYGVVRIVDYFKNRDISPFFAGELILGVVLVGIGLFSFLNPGGIFAILPVIFGILVLVEGISKLQRALMLRRYGYPRWVAALVLAIAIMVLGVVLVLNPFGALVMTVRVLGAVILQKLPAALLGHSGHPAAALLLLLAGQLVRHPGRAGARPHRIGKDVHLGKADLPGKGERLFKFLLGLAGETYHDVGGDGWIVKLPANPRHQLAVEGGVVVAVHPL